MKGRREGSEMVGNLVKLNVMSWRRVEVLISSRGGKCKHGKDEMKRRSRSSVALCRTQVSADHSVSCLSCQSSS